MNRIKQLRIENNWSQAELADRLQCAMSSIAMYEREDRKPSLEVLIKLSEIFNCSIDYLLSKSNIRNPEKQTEIKDIYMHLAKEAQDLKLDKEDVDYIINFYKRHKK